MRSRSRLALLAATSAMVAACSGAREVEVADSNVADTPVAAAPAPAAPLAKPAEAPLAPLTAEGWGPLKIGMTAAQVTAALGPDANPQAVGGPDPESCDQYRPVRASDGMLVMIESGRLTRISLIRDSKVKTDRGLGLGAPAAAVRAAYGAKAEASLHKYEDKPAEYLTVWATGGGPADHAVPPHSRGIQYEVNGSGSVGAIHAGGPSILYVEGCA